MTTRSTVLAAGKSLGTKDQVVYRVPVGQTWIVKSLSATNFAAAALFLQVATTRPASSVSTWVFNKELAVQEIVAAQTWLVLEDEDQLVITAAGPDIHWWVSGARLVP